MRKKQLQNPSCSRQLIRLKMFLEYEEEQAKILDYLSEMNSARLPFQVLTVLVFIMHGHYRDKPGSLGCMYLVWKSEEAEGKTQQERYCLYYKALFERGFL